MLASPTARIVSLSDRAQPVRRPHAPPAVYDDGQLKAQGPPDFVGRVLELHFQDKKSERIARILTPWSRIGLVLITAWTFDAFEWAEKIIEFGGKAYRFLAGGV